jgi:hypothetical protein
MQPSLGLAPSEACVEVARPTFVDLAGVGVECDD